MAASSFLPFVPRHSLFPLRHCSKFAAAEVCEPPLVHYQHTANVKHAQFAEEQPAVALQLQLQLNSFHVDLAHRLQQLRLHGTANAHLNWLTDALASTLSTHSSLQSSLHTAASSRSPSPATLLKHRADEVLSLLDVSTVLIQVADSINRQFGCLQHALQSVEEALKGGKHFSSGRGRTAARRLSSCLRQDTLGANALYGATAREYSPLEQAQGSLLRACKKEFQSVPTKDPVATLLSRAVDGAMLTSLLVLTSAVSSLALPSRRRRPCAFTCASKLSIKYLRATTASAPWGSPLHELYRDLRKEKVSGASGALFRQLQALYSAGSKIHAVITNPAVDPVELAGVKQSTESLRKSLRDSQTCMTMFRAQMACLFRALIALRLNLFDA